MAHLPAHPCDCTQQRLEDVQQHPRHPPNPIKPVRALLVNLWVLLLCIGVLLVVLLGKARLHVPEPLEHVHAISGVEPYIIPLGAAQM